MVVFVLFYHNIVVCVVAFALILEYNPIPDSNMAAMELSEPTAFLESRINQINLNAVHVLPPSTATSDTGLQRYALFTFFICA